MSESLRLFLKVKTSIWIAIILIYSAGLYYFANFLLYKVFSVSLGFYLVQPLCWSLLALIGWLGYRNLENKPILNRRLVIWAGLAGVLQTALLFQVASFFFKFGNSPYGRDIQALLGNLLYITTLSLGIEFSRAFLGVALGNRRPGLALAIVTILVTLMTIPAGQYLNLGTPASILVFLGSFALPIFAKSLLATFLAMSGGPLASIAYSGALLLLEWLPPILPNLPWMVKAFIETLYPIIALMLFNNWLAPTNQLDVPVKAILIEKKSNVFTTWVLVVVFALGMFGINTGLFGVRPFLVSGGSMNPTLYAGDIVFASPVQTSSLAIGDIIRFSQRNMEIVHRIVQIKQDETGKLVFITRGDNNTSDDAPVMPEDIEGRTVLVIPKIGWVAIVIRNLFSLIGAAS